MVDMQSYRFSVILFEATNSKHITEIYYPCDVSRSVNFSTSVCSSGIQLVRMGERTTNGQTSIHYLLHVILCVRANCLLQCTISTPSGREQTNWWCVMVLFECRQHNVKTVSGTHTTQSPRVAWECRWGEICRVKRCFVFGQKAKWIKSNQRAAKEW